MIAFLFIAAGDQAIADSVNQLFSDLFEGAAEAATLLGVAWMSFLYLKHVWEGLSK